ncbi:MAG: hypothetical protein ACOZIN_09750 [Myxococcota bacterium]
MDADVKTLRLAAPVISADGVARLVTYQRLLLERAKTYGLVEAHALARATVGLDALDLEHLRSVCADFCGRRWAARKLLARRDEARAKGQGALAERIGSELPRLEDLSTLEERYSSAAISLLREREEELIALHQEVHRLYGGVA